MGWRSSCWDAFFKIYYSYIRKCLATHELSQVCVKDNGSEEFATLINFTQERRYKDSYRVLWHTSWKTIQLRDHSWENTNHQWHARTLQPIEFDSNNDSQQKDNTTVKPFQTLPHSTKISNTSIPREVERNNWKLKTTMTLTSSPIPTAKTRLKKILSYLLI